MASLSPACGIIIATLAGLVLQLDAVSLSEDASCRFDLPLAERSNAPRATSSPAGDWKQFRAELYKDGLSGYKEIPEEELTLLNANHSAQRGCRPSTFGELDAERIFRTPAFALGADDVLADLGSGVGQAVISGVLFFNASRGLGIELSKGRFERSCAALERLGSVLQSEMCGEQCRARAAKPGRIEMWNANLLEIDLSEVTAVMMYANCFPEALQGELQRKLLLELPLGARVHTTDNLGWDKRLVLNGRTLSLIPRVGMLLYRVEEAPPEEMDDMKVLEAYLAKVANGGSDRVQFSRSAEEL